MIFFDISVDFERGQVEVANQNKNVILQAKVVAVNVEGLKRTKDDIVMASVKDLFNVR